ncbi:MAG: rod shape-determining protein RodA [Anaerolineae bacterium]|nr:rod shape-determining protein RodA [Anaerolineae bacterium]NIN98312.1 rod shape-determining protein RodA [Anaerolineae bacterium]NIQ81241.1 rod shape-determining protein RodA [Anaerolineae bacterium]
MALGVALIYSATLASAPPSQDWWDTFLARQIIYAVLGIALMLLVSFTDYSIFANVNHLIYGLTILSLILVYAVGQISFGAQRWISLGFFDLQPSELAKVLLIIVLAKFLADRREDLKRLPYFLMSLVYVAVPIVFVYIQPDLGTAIVLGVCWLAMVLMAGVRFRHLGLIAAIGLIASPLVWSALHGYMRERIFVFLNPERDPLGAGYNINQARIAVGSGGWLGQGFARGSQSQLHFLRVRHTDYVFSVLGEELGFVGVVLVLILFLVVIWRMLRAAEMARDTFGQLIACGITTVIAFQVIANIGMNVGLLPSSGVPLPFVSYGGSALVALLIGEGVVQNIIIRHKRLEFQ